VKTALNSARATCLSRWWSLRR